MRRNQDAAFIHLGSKIIATYRASVDRSLQPISARGLPSALPRRVVEGSSPGSCWAAVGRALSQLCWRSHCQRSSRKL